MSNETYEAARVRAYRAMRLFEPSMEGYNAAVAVYEAAFGETDGNQAATQSSGDNRGSAAQKSNSQTGTSLGSGRTLKEVIDHLRSRVDHLERIVPSELSGDDVMCRNGEYVQLFDVQRLIDQVGNALLVSSEAPLQTEAENDLGASLLRADQPASPSTTEPLPIHESTQYHEDHNETTFSLGRFIVVRREWGKGEYSWAVTDDHGNGFCTPFDELPQLLALIGSVSQPLSEASPLNAQERSEKENVLPVSESPQAQEIERTGSVEEARLELRRYVCREFGVQDHDDDWLMPQIDALIAALRAERSVEIKRLKEWLRIREKQVGDAAKIIELAEAQLASLARLREYGPSHKDDCAWEWHMDGIGNVPCSCGLDTLLDCAAVVGEKEHKDHSAALLPADPSAAVTTETLPNRDVYCLPEHRGFSGICGGLSCKAVLLRLGDEMETVIEFRYPPPRDYREPIRRKFGVIPDTYDPRYESSECRAFVRDDRLRSPDHQWWLAYNNGRTKTPMDAYVYREVARVGSGTPPLSEASASPHRSESAEKEILKSDPLSEQGDVD